MSTLALLVRHRLRRDRAQIPIWIVSIAGFVFVAAVGLEDTFGSLAERTVLMRLATANPAIMLLRGPPQGPDLDAVLIFTLLAFLSVLAGLMNTFLAVRHLRAEEESGRAAIVSSTPAARLSPPMATLLYGIGVNVVLFLAVSGCFVAAGQDLSGSLVTGLALAAVGVTFLAVGAVASEVMPTARAANGIGVGAVLLSYLLRGLGDASGTVSADGLSVQSAWPSWLSPIGWAQQTHPFTENTLTPLLLNVAVAVILIASAALVVSRRDSGASVLATGAGRPEARPILSGSLGLAWRLQWPSIVAWSLGGALFGVFGGALATAVNDATLGDSPIADELGRLGGGRSLAEAFVAVIFTVVGVVAAGSAIQAIVRLRQEEALGTGNVLLATPMVRQRWLTSYLAVGGIAIVTVLVVAAAASAVAAQLVGAPENIDISLQAAAAQLPAALLFLAGTALLWALVPRLTAALGWAALLVAVFLGIFGQLIGLPDWTADLSPFTHSPQPAGADTDWSGGIVMTALALIAGVAATVLFRRRDVEST